MATTTLVGWSLEKHSDFVRKLGQHPRKRLVRQRLKTLHRELSEALGYRKYADSQSYAHQRMVEAMTQDSGWYKCREREVNFERRGTRQNGGRRK